MTWFPSPGVLRLLHPFVVLSVRGRGRSMEGVGGSMSTPRERAEKKRREKLALISEQLASGDLTIRQMTPAERKKHPPRPAAPRRKRW